MLRKNLYIGFIIMGAVLLGKATPARGSGHTNVQGVLRAMAEYYPDKLGYIAETGRYYILVPRSEAVPEAWLVRIQEAFYADISGYCQQYGNKYLADWRALASKAARESFWGTSYLCNRINNYFGIRQKAKPWVCESFGFCEGYTRNDPQPSEFVSFPSFEASLWMFIHTMYSLHFLERLPDQGERVIDAIAFERMNGIHYWENTAYGISMGPQLKASLYTTEELIYTWSEHPINNLCVNCSRQTDREWVDKLVRAGLRFRG